MEAKIFFKEISGGAHSVKILSSDLIDFLKGPGLDKDTLFEIKLCVEEAVRNAMVHGNRSDEKLPVKVSCRVDDDGIRIEVEDRGKGFDHKAVPDPTKADNLTKGSGRGVYLIKKLMDRVEFNDRGNIIVMHKKI